jgi:hypothetical protein
MILRRCGIVSVLTLLLPAAASAQSQGEGLAKLVPDLILTGITLPGAGDPGTPHAGHFTLGNPTFGGSQGASRPDFAAIAAVEAFGDRLKSQVANFPLGSSTGGFTYAFDAALGTFSRRSASFGPAFTERAATIGRGKRSLGFNFQHTSFDTFGGEDLRDRSITFYLPHTDCCNPAAPPPSELIPGFEGDIVEAALNLKASNDTFALFANFGLTDRLDVGIAIPITRVSLDASVRATIIRLSTFATPLVHTFVQGQDVSQQVFEESGTASGIGDVVLRSKYSLYTKGETGISAALDLRLPTGREEDLLGVGTTQAKIYAIVSSGNRRIAPHLNLGYTFSGRGNREIEFIFEPLGASDEFNYAGGVEIVVNPKLTVIGDFLGRTLIDAGTVNAEPKSFRYREGAGAPATAPLLTSSTNPVTNLAYRQLALTPGNLNLQLGSTGFKFNPGGNLLVTGNLLFPLNKAGLRDRVTVAFGLDYQF